MIKFYTGHEVKHTSESNRANSSKRGLVIGEILVKIIGNLNLLKNGILKEQNSDDTVMIFSAFNIWFLFGIKVVDDMIETAKHKFQIDLFLRDT